eukprot:5021271-Amphidinium_carterae.1
MSAHLAPWSERCTQSFAQQNRTETRGLLGVLMHCWGLQTKFNDFAQSVTASLTSLEERMASFEACSTAAFDIQVKRALKYSSLRNT